MFNRFTQRIVSSWRFIAILLGAILLIITSFLILINQRSSISNSNYLDEFLIFLSAIFILTITVIFIVLVYRTIIPINKKKVASFSNRFSLYFISMALTPAVIAGNFRSSFS
jgi:nitrogen fixation/metabolism regulation signal transduction histidine kinase